MKRLNSVLFCGLSFLGSSVLGGTAFADISISVDASAGVQKISPYIYGRNIDVISDGEESDAALLEKENGFYSKVLEWGMHFMGAII